MRRVFALFFILSSLSLFANCSFQLGTGYREDSLNFSLAGPFGSPNILSELVWKDIESFQLSAITRGTIGSGMYFRLSGDYAWILEGRNRDSDFDGDDMTLEFSRSLSDTKGNLYDASIGCGRPLSFFSMQVVPLVGFSVHGQNLHDTNGVQVIAENPDFLGPFDGLHSSYTTLWYGPWAGLDLLFNYSSLSFWGTIEYHRVWYQGKGHWNLRTDFLDDFRHDSCGNGFVAGVGVDWNLFYNLFLGFAFSIQEWHADAGVDKVRVGLDVLDGQGNVVDVEPIEINTRLNGVNWHSWNASLTLTLLF